MSELRSCRVVGETPREWEIYLKKYEARYLCNFKDYEEYELFMGLPVPDTFREVLLAAMSKDKEAKSCPGVAGSSEDHRKRCLLCCWKFPQT